MQVGFFFIVHTSLNRKENQKKIKKTSTIFIENTPVDTFIVLHKKVVSFWQLSDIYIYIELGRWMYYLFSLKRKKVGDGDI